MERATLLLVLTKDEHLGPSFQSRREPQITSLGWEEVVVWALLAFFQQGRLETTASSPQTLVATASGGASCPIVGSGLAFFFRCCYMCINGLFLS